MDSFERSLSNYGGDKITNTNKLKKTKKTKGEYYRKLVLSLKTNIVARS